MNVLEGASPDQKDVSSSDTSHEAAFERIVRNSFFNVVGISLILPFNFVALFTLARRLGKESLGLYFTVFAISSVIFLICSAGITTVLTRRIARYPDRLRELIAEATGLLLLVCTTSTAALSIVCGTWLWFRQEPAFWLILLAAGGALAARHTLEFCAAAVRGLERFEFENLARIVQTGLFVVFVIVFVGPGLEGAITGLFSFAASNIIASILLAGILLIKWRCGGFSLGPSIVRDWLS